MSEYPHNTRFAHTGFRPLIILRLRALVSRVLSWFLGFRVSGLRGTSVEDPRPAHDNYINLRLPKFLATATLFCFPWSHPAGSRANHTFWP